MHWFEVPGVSNPTAGSLQDNWWACGINGTGGHQWSCAWSVGFCTSLLPPIELKLTYDLFFIWRSSESVIGSCEGIHLVSMKGISNRSPLSACWLLQCLQMEWDSLLWKWFLGLSLEAFSDDRKELLCLYSLLHWMCIQPSLSLFCQTGRVSDNRVSTCTGHTAPTYWTISFSFIVA